MVTPDFYPVRETGDREARAHTHPAGGIPPLTSPLLHAMNKSSLYHDIIRIHPELREQPRNHSEYFERPLELASGLANADIVLSSDGCRPLTSGGEVVLIRHPRAQSPGTFGKVKGKLVKAKSQSSVKSQRWHDPHEEARTVASAMRRTRLLSGMFYKPSPKVKLRDLEKRREEALDRYQHTALQRLTAAA